MVTVVVRNMSSRFNDGIAPRNSVKTEGVLLTFRTFGIAHLAGNFVQNSAHGKRAGTSHSVEHGISSGACLLHQRRRPHSRRGQRQGTCAVARAHVHVYVCAPKAEARCARTTTRVISALLSAPHVLHSTQCAVR
jgi:hypothetical protein